LSNRRRTNLYLAALAGVVALAVVVAIGWFTPAIHDKVAAMANKPSAPLKASDTNSVTSTDKRVTLVFPTGMSPNTIPVAFDNRPQDTKVFNKTARGVSALSDPIDIHPKSAAQKLPANKLTIVLPYTDAELSAKGITSTNLGISVYDTNLSAWVPLLNAVVDTEAHTVSAVAPHFSKFVQTFLDGAKSVVHVGGAVVKTVVNGTVSVVEWFKNLFKELIVSTVKDLIGTGPELSCKPKSTDLAVSVDSFKNRLTGCVENPHNGDRSQTLHLGNGFSFPLLSDGLAKGFSIGWSDASTNGDDLAALLRSWFWATQKRATVSKTDQGSLTVTSALTSSKDVVYRLDGSAVPFDIVIAFAMTLAPEGNALKTGAQKGLKDFLLKGKKASDNPKDLIGDTFGALGCVVTNLHNQPPKIFSPDSYKWAVNIAKSCLNTMLIRFNLESSLADMIGVLKTVPETIESTLAATVQMLSLGKVNTTTNTVTVKRELGINPDYVGTWHGHGTDVTITKDGKPAKFTVYVGLCNDVSQCGFTGQATPHNATKGITFTVSKLRYFLSGGEESVDIPRSQFISLNAGVTGLLNNGDTFTLQWQAPKVFKVGFPAGVREAFPPFLCAKKGVSVANQKYCGA
jgi:hypothetical protein